MDRHAHTGVQGFAISRGACAATSARAAVGIASRGARARGAGSQPSDGPILVLAARTARGVKGRQVYAAGGAVCD